MLTPLQRIDTKDAAGNPNGYVVPIWRADSGVAISQVYLTAVTLGHSKGPHLHRKRHGRFTCISGVADIILRDPEAKYWVIRLDSAAPTMLDVPPGTAAEIRCGPVGCTALLLNMPDPAWSAEDPDEWPVENWNPPC